MIPGLICINKSDQELDHRFYNGKSGAADRCNGPNNRMLVRAAKGGLYCARKVLIGYSDFSHSSGLGKHIFKWN